MKFPKFLRIAVVAKPGIVNLTKTNDGNYRIIGGPEGRLAEFCARALKFAYQVMPAKDGSWGNFKDGKWDGAIGMVYRNEADIGISKFGVSELRLKYVNYSFPYTIEDFTFATQKPGLSPPADAFVRPFDFEVWLGIIFALVIMSVFFSIIQKLKIAKSTLQVFSILIANSIQTRDKTLKDKILVSSWVWGCLILSYSYTAVLLSFLTIPAMDKIPETVQELSSAVTSGRYKATTYSGSMALNELLSSRIEATQLIGRFIEQNDYLIEANRKSILPLLRKGKIALISPKDTLRNFVLDEFFISKDSFKSHPTGIVMSNTFCCKNQIDSFVHTLYATGLYRKYVEDELFMTGLKSKSFEKPDPIKNTLKPLSLRDMYDAFVLIIIGHSMACILVLAEIIHFKFHSRKKCEDLRSLKL